MGFLDLLGRLSGLKPPPKTPPIAPTVAPSSEAGLWSLDTPLLQFNSADHWTIRDACQGTQIFGETGSGKTSGSGRALATAFLRSGFGGLVLTAKPDETGLWRRYCEEAGRLEKLIVFSPDNPFRFDFLRYEHSRPGEGAGTSQNLVKLFMELLATDGKKRGGGDAFWQDSLEHLLRNAIDLVSLATGKVTLPTVNDAIKSAPYDRADAESEQWRRRSYCWQCLEEAGRNAEAQGRSLDFAQTQQYWLREFPTLADRTRSIIVSMFTSRADPFLRGVYRELFCNGLNIVPENTFDGAIIVLDLPVETYSEEGRFAQNVFKYVWQRATSRRDPMKQKGRPVFLWADESQFFANTGDASFQQTARSKRACTVYLTQNLSNYYAAFGGEGDKAAVDALLGNLTTKIFHTNGNFQMNQWAADTLSRSLQQRSTTSSSRQGAQISLADTMEYKEQPASFQTLRNGGARNGGKVDAIIFQSGRRWAATNDVYLKHTFQQA